MKITIVSLRDDNMCETFVGAVVGAVSDEQRREMATGHDAEYRPNEGGVPYDIREITFAEVELAETPDALRQLLNQDDQN